MRQYARIEKMLIEITGQFTIERNLLSVMS